MRSIDVRERRDEVAVAVRVAHPAPGSFESLCLKTPSKTIHLRRPLDNREVEIGGLGHGPVPAPIQQPGEL